MVATTYPDEVKHLPVNLRKMLAAQCEGDWSRVTVERGTVTVHNKPQENGLAVRSRARKAPATAAPAPVRRTPPPPSAAPAPTPTAPRAPLRRVHVPAAKQRPEPIPMPTPAPPAVVEPPPPAVTAAPPPEQPKKKLRPAAEVLFQAPTPEVRPEEEDDRRFVLLPGDGGFTTDDAEQFIAKAWRLAEIVAAGVGDKVPLSFHDDVTALNGLDLEQVESVVRHAQRVEVDGSTGWKKYPILKFYRGDNMVVVGFREPTLPKILAAYFTSLIDADATGKGARMTGGGGGKRRTGGLPNTPTKLISALRAMHATVPDPGPTDKVVAVTFNGQDVGKVPVDPAAGKKEIESAYQRTLRKIQAIRQREQSGRVG